MLDERDYISKIINTLLESLNKIVLNINTIDIHKKEDELNDIPIFFKKNLGIDLNDFISIKNFVNNDNNKEYAEALIKYYYIQYFSNKKIYKDICLVIIDIYKNKYRIFNLSIDKIENYLKNN